MTKIYLKNGAELEILEETQLGYVVLTNQGEQIFVSKKETLNVDPIPQRRTELKQLEDRLFEVKSQLRDIDEELEKQHAQLKSGFTYYDELLMIINNEARYVIYLSNTCPHIKSIKNLTQINLVFRKSANMIGFLDACLQGTSTDFLLFRTQEEAEEKLIELLKERVKSPYYDNATSLATYDRYNISIPNKRKKKLIEKQVAKLKRAINSQKNYKVNSERIISRDEKQLKKLNEKLQKL